MHSRAAHDGSATWSASSDPIVQTGMGWVAGARLTAATSAAGGLGILAAVTMTPTQLEHAVREVKARTDKPFGVNFRADQPDLDERIAFVIARGRAGRVVRRGADDATAIGRLHDAGVLVMPTVGARRHAEKMLEWGVDAVIAQGGEGGGHTGTVPTSLLLPQVVDAVGARSRCSARAASTTDAASSPRWRTARTASPWAPASCSRRRAGARRRKDRYVAASVTDTVVTTAIDGAPQRVIRTDVVDRIERSARVTRASRAPCASALALPQGDRHVVRATSSRGSGDDASNQDLTWSQVALAANAPMLIKAAMVDGKPEVGVLPTGQVTGVSTSCRPSRNCSTGS